MTSPTGRRVIPFSQLRAQEEASWRMMQRMRQIALDAGAKEVGVDTFIVSGDYSVLEQRMMEAMREPLLLSISGDSDGEA